MKNFTLSLLCTLAALFCSTASFAQFAISDVFGKYQFSADLEVTEAGKEYAELFSQTGEVTIKADNTYFLAQVSPFAGGVDIHYINKVDAANNQFMEYNPNGNANFWGSLAIANAEGEYPFYDPATQDSYQLTYTYDPETGNILLPDFTAVSCRAPEDPVTVMAKFTNCKLVLVEKEVIEIANLTGEYAFVGEYTNSESDFPTTFDLTLTATNEDFTSYTATIKYEAYDAITIEGAKFDGLTLTLPIDSTYIDHEAPYLFATWNPISFKGDIAFNLVAPGKLSLQSLAIATLVPVDVENEDGTTTTVIKGKVVQWYGAGVAKDKNIQEVSLAGTYRVICDSPYFFMPEEAANFPTDFTIVVDEDMYGYAVTEFMGFNTADLNYGGIPCQKEDNTLKIEAGGDYSFLRMAGMANDYSWMEYDVLFDPTGEAGYVTITVNEDGTCKISDFFIKRLHQIMNDDGSMTTVSVQEVAYYGFMSAELVPADIASVSQADAAAKVYTLNGACVGSNLDNLPKGIYVVKRGGKAVKVAK